MHGAADLPLVHVDSYNEELCGREGFLGDRASNRAFHEILDEWRTKLRRVDKDPLGDDEEVKKKKLDKIIAEGDAKEAGLVQTVIEEFAQEFSKVVQEFLRLKSWRDTGCIVVGGQNLPNICFLRYGETCPEIAQTGRGYLLRRLQ